MRSDCNKDKTDNVKSLEKIFKIKIKNKGLFQKALTHSSFSKENNLSSLENYERLEFLGDAVLKLSISSILWKNFPEYPEGELTKIRSIIVSDNALADIGAKIGLKPLIVLGAHEEKMGGRDKKSILACMFEAILGAYYLDGQTKEISDFLEEIFTPMIKEVDEHFEKFNAKAVLQEYTQSQNKTTPTYKVVDEVGPEHDKIFVVEVSFNGENLAQGKGKTKREAEQASAYEACKKLKIIK